MPSPRIVLGSGLRAARTSWQTLSALVHLLALLSLFPGMLVVQAALELAFGVIRPSPEMSGLLLAAAGLAWLLVAVILVEFNPLPPRQKKNGDHNSSEDNVHRLTPKYEAWEVIFPPGGQTVIEIVLFQWIVIVLYALMLDGGIRFRGCLYSYLLYLVGPIIFFARRGLALTKLNLIYLKWAWLPFITFGVPLYVSVSKGKWPIT